MNIHEYFMMLQEMADQGKEYYTATPFEKVGDIKISPLNYEHDFVSKNIYIKTVKKNEKLITPDCFSIECYSPDLFPISCPIDKTNYFALESNIHNWDKELAQKNRFWGDPPNYQHFFILLSQNAPSTIYYRYKTKTYYRYKAKTDYQYKTRTSHFIDSFSNDISNIQNVGLTTVIPDRTKQTIVLFLGLNKNHDLLKEYASDWPITFQLTRLPNSFSSKQKQIDIFPDRHSSLILEVSLSHEKRKHLHTIELTCDVINKTIISIPIEINYRYPPIYIEAVPVNAFLHKMVPYGKNEKIIFDIKTLGIGNLNFTCFGNGLRKDTKITSSQNYAIHPVSINLNTMKLFPMKDTKQTVLIWNNSRVLNKRMYKFTLKTMVVRLFSYPKSKLNYENIPWQSKITETVQFIRSDFKKNIEQLYLRIPTSLNNVLIAKIPPKKDDIVKFNFDFSKIEADRLIKSSIKIKAICSDGLSIKFSLPITIKAISCQPENPIQFSKWIDGKSKYMTITFNNNTNVPFEIFDIHWKNKLFDHIVTLDHFIRPSSLILINTTKQFIFFPTEKGSWYKEKNITDIVTIRSNLKDTPVFQKALTVDLSKDKLLYKLLKKIGKIFGFYKNK